MGKRVNSRVTAVGDARNRAHVHTRLARSPPPTRGQSHSSTSLINAKVREEKAPFHS